MKIKYFASIILLLLVFSSCRKEYKLNTNVSSPGKLLAPINNNAYTLAPASTNEVVFSWESAVAEDGGLVLYEVKFDKQGGDFSHPAYTIVSDEKGTKTQLTLSHKALNKIAALAGIKSLETGTVQWRVYATKAGFGVPSSEIRTLKLTRPAGIADVPDQLYLYGTATEAAAIGSAIQFKRKEEGVFEMITSLKEGSFFISDAKTGTPRNFSIAQASPEVSNTPNTATGAKMPYRITVDFISSIAKVEVIEEVKMHCIANGATIALLTYVDGQKFTANDAVFKFLVPGGPGAPSWLGWTEERYKFSMKIGGKDVGFGSGMNPDMNGADVLGAVVYNGRPDGGQPTGYFNVYQIANNYWAGAYKMATQFNGAPINIVLDCSGTLPEYTHHITAAPPAMASPAALYLTGSATEGGAAIANALPMMKIKDGVFEIITSLKAGDYSIVDGLGSAARQFYNASDKIKEGANVMTQSGGTAPYIIRMDFNKATFIMMKVQSMEAYAIPYGWDGNAFHTTLAYMGRGRFKSAPSLVKFWYGWNYGEERYRFRINTDKGAMYYGSYMNGDMSASIIPGMTATDQRPDNGTEPAGYFNTYPIPPVSDWDGCYKFSSAAENNNCVIEANFSSSGYYHTVTIQ